MRELESGLWWWQAVHPEWEPEDAATEDWGPEVSSYAVENGARLILIDPTIPPFPVSELLERREVVIILTCPWHRRDTDKLVERFEAEVFSPPPETQADAPNDHVFVAGQQLEVGIEAFPGMEPMDLVLWIETRRAIVAGDTLIDRGHGLEFPTDWANKGVPAERILESLQPLLELDAQRVLPTHGVPADQASLVRALSSARS